tara:strand:+ start:6631 stop:7383 length:753 start_codon:yes stop_codon:yes gene_type:complete
MTTEEILKQCTVEDLVVKLPNIQLDRKDYLQVKKQLELIGGKWKGGKVAGFVFKTDPTELLESIAGGAKRNLKKEYQFFATPPKTALQLVVLVGRIKSHHRVLEPSAGQGAIIRELNVIGIKPYCFELMEQNRIILEQSGLDYELLGDDFLAEHPEDMLGFDAIIANPPFSKNQDIDHVRKMYSMLNDDGIIVSITSNSWRNGNQKKQKAFKEWLADIGAVVIDLEEGTFKESGTMVGANIVLIKKGWND